MTDDRYEGSADGPETQQDCAGTGVVAAGGLPLDLFWALVDPDGQRDA